MSQVPAGQAEFFSRQTFAGMPWMVLNKGLLFPVYMASSILTVRLLDDPDQYGVLEICRSIGEYVVIACSLGLNAAMSRFIPELVVHENRAGLVRLLWRAALPQLLAGLTCLGLLVVFQPALEGLFRVDFQGYLVLTGLFVLTLQLKNFVNTTFTGFLAIGMVAALSAINGVLLLLALVIGLKLLPDVASVLLAQVTTVALVYAVGIVLLRRFLRALPWKSPPRGIGRRRILHFASAALVNNLGAVLMQRYSEVFFLAAVAESPAIVGAYSLGAMLPSLVIFFVPNAVQELFTVSFIGAYVRDPTCLPVLVSSLYKMLLVATVPLSALGVVMSDKLIVLLYTEDMSAAGPVAAAFCGIQLLPLISIPLSMAIKAKEKVLSTLPLLGLHLAVNLLLDWLLIVELNLGALGGVLAVLGSFLLTLPIRLYVVRRLIGGIWFPIGFALRLIGVFGLAALLIVPLLPHLDLAGAFLVGGLYTLLTPVLLRVFRLIREEDVAVFRTLGMARVDALLGWLVGGPKAR